VRPESNRSKSARPGDLLSLVLNGIGVREFVLGSSGPVRISFDLVVGEAHGIESELVKTCCGSLRKSKRRHCVAATHGHPSTQNKNGSK
jgi:hypothetical protein